MPGNVSHVSRSKIESNLYSQVEERSYVELKNGDGFFSKFDYQEDPYEDFLDRQSQERKIAKARQEALHKNQPFRG